MSAVALAFATIHVIEQPFPDINMTYTTFRAMARAFRGYRLALSGVAPVYDRTTDAGPPFDMYYHLEVLHRGLHAGQAWLDAAEASWQDLGFES